MKFLVYNEFSGFLFIEVKTDKLEDAYKHLIKIYGNHFIKLPKWLHIKENMFLTERAS